MNTLARLILLAGILSLTACGGAGDDHAHDGTAEDHAHDGADAHAHDADEAHEHGDDSHSHDAPETEAFYGEEAPADDAASLVDEPGDAAEVQEAAEDAVDESSEMHSHGDSEPHTHDH